MTICKFGRRPSASAQSINPELEVGPRWKLGLVTDHSGRVHLGACFPGSEARRPALYVDLLAAVGAASVDHLDLDQFSVIVQGERVADLRRIIGQCIDDVRLKQRLLELVSLSMERS